MPKKVQLCIKDVPHGFDVSKGGMEYAFTQLLVAFALPLLGPGRYSLGRGLGVFQGLAYSRRLVARRKEVVLS